MENELMIKFKYSKRRLTYEVQPPEIKVTAQTDWVFLLKQENSQCLQLSFGSLFHFPHFLHQLAEGNWPSIS